MEDSELDALPDSLRAFVCKIGAEKKVPFDAVLGAIYDGCSKHQIEAFDSDRFAYFVRGNPQAGADKPTAHRRGHRGGRR